MGEILYILLAFITGLILGTVFFAGLWFTVNKAVHARYPAIWFIGSFLIRFGIVLLGFYLVGAGHWLRLVICLLAFIIARFLVVHYTRSVKKGGQHEIKS